ncbi:MAG: hypothetical protein EZS26_002616 [Candidatus Ordinivivax streblomastigis]|uniref:Uncharacterized protein n=1 Tax=Candidatus Ordinivivax streblomastigis TaxID=2540710 RepID=A0A5M8NXD5_9BACT|nr:MAG: hypothetical protein EZS26_002616 [Candidatus Ordinivivax streblomastigis]
MKNKSNKYIWIAFCSIMAVPHIVFLIIMSSLDKGPITAINVTYILIFATAIIRELNINKVVFYVMFGITLLVWVYGLFFAKLW